LLLFRNCSVNPNSSTKKMRQVLSYSTKFVKYIDGRVHDTHGRNTVPQSGHDTVLTPQSDTSSLTSSCGDPAKPLCVRCGSLHLLSGTACVCVHLCMCVCMCACVCACVRVRVTQMRMTSDQHGARGCMLPPELGRVFWVLGTHQHLAHQRVLCTGGEHVAWRPGALSLGQWVYL